MSIDKSLLRDLLQAIPYLNSQIYFKSSLIALSHGMEDLMLSHAQPALVIANFQQERYYRQEIRRYREMAKYTDQIYILAAPESESGFAVVNPPCETISLENDDGLAQEWHLVIIGQEYTACLICREVEDSTMDQMRRFEGFWTFDRQITQIAAKLLLEKIVIYRPELREKIDLAFFNYNLREVREVVQQPLMPITTNLKAGIFAERLVTYLQASYYKLFKAYDNLTEVNIELETLRRIQSNLIAIVGHELRTPLSTIQVCLESVASEPEMPREFRETMLEIALGDADRLRQLIQDFLHLSKLETAQKNFYPETIRIREIIDLVCSKIKSNSQTQLPKIKVNIPQDLPLVRADGEGLLEVFSKLLDNACKFTDANGEIIIQAKIHHLMLEIIITDTGRGIEPQLLHVIFDRFYQEEDSLRRTVGGTGLGLAICRQIVESMGGKIWAFSLGKTKGSEFHFTIPIS